MAKIVHGGDQYNAVEIAPLVSAADDPTYPGEFYRVPMAGETGVVQRDTTPQSPEIQASGALKLLDYGPGHWRAQLRTRLFYNARWQALLWSHLMGGLEGLSQNRLLTGSTAAPSTTANAHWYIPQSYKSTLVGSGSAIPWGLCMRVWKMGPDNVDGTGHKLLRCYVVGMTLEAAQNTWPIVTWDIVGPEPSQIVLDGLTPLAADTGDYAVRPRDLSTDPLHPKLPSKSEIQAPVLGTRNLMSMRIRVDNKLNYPGRFLTSYDTDWNIGHTGQIEVTADFETLLEQGEGSFGAGTVWGHWAVGDATLPSTLRRFRFTSAKDGDVHTPTTPMVDETNDIPYAFEIAGTLAKVTALQNPIESGAALRMRWSERWYIGTIPATGYANASAYLAPILVAQQVAQTDEPVADTKFHTTAEGSNDPHTTLNG